MASQSLNINIGYLTLDVRFLNLSKRNGLGKSITKERKKDLVTQKRKHVMKRI